MNLEPLPVGGAALLTWDRHIDSRGFFQRVLCTQTLEDHGLISRFHQHSVSSNISSGTLRGMHLQLYPHSETKIVSCLRGKVFDVIVDVRLESPTFSQHYGVELRADDPQALYIPAGFAHGFLTLEDNSMLMYAIDKAHAPEAAVGFHHLDTNTAIRWPARAGLVSESDSALPDFSELAQRYDQSVQTGA